MVKYEGPREGPLVRAATVVSRLIFYEQPVFVPQSRHV